MQELKRRAPYREKQIQKLFHFLHGYSLTLPSSILMTGCVDTGKSYCLDGILRCLRYKHVVVRCDPYQSYEGIYKIIMPALGDDNAGLRCKCKQDFLDGLNRIARKRLVRKPIVVVFDNFGLLYYFYPDMFAILSRLGEHCKLNICSIFISDNYGDDYITTRMPRIIHFDKYNKKQLFNIIYLQRKNYVEDIFSKYTIKEDIKIEIGKPELFAEFLRLFFSIFYDNEDCHNLIVLRYMARVNFEILCEPLILNEMNATDISKLLEHVTPNMLTSSDMLKLSYKYFKDREHDLYKENW